MITTTVFGIVFYIAAAIIIIALCAFLVLFIMEMVAEAAVGAAKGVRALLFRKKNSVDGESEKKSSAR